MQLPYVDKYCDALLLKKYISTGSHRACGE